MSIFFILFHLLLPLIILRKFHHTCLCNVSGIHVFATSTGDISLSILSLISLYTWQFYVCLGFMYYLISMLHHRSLDCLQCLVQMSGAWSSVHTNLSKKHFWYVHWTFQLIETASYQLAFIKTRKLKEHSRIYVGEKSRLVSSCVVVYVGCVAVVMEGADSHLSGTPSDKVDSWWAKSTHKIRISCLT